MTKFWLPILLTVFNSITYGQTNELTPQVCIAHFKKDSMRVSVNDIINDPIIRICDTAAGIKILKFRLTLNINGVIYEQIFKKNTRLQDDQIEKLKTVRNDMPEYNQLFIEEVEYQTADSETGHLNGLFLWLSNGQNCTEENGKFKIEKETYKNGDLRFKSFYCNGDLIKMNNYRKDGTLIGTKNFSYTPDTVMVLDLFRKDGSKIIYERQVNGLDDGDYFIYYQDGSTRLEAKNIKGIRICEKLYDKEGQLQKESKCNESGIDCWVKIYNKNGQVKKERDFKHAIKLKGVF